MAKNNYHTISVICEIQNRKQQINKTNKLIDTVWCVPESKGGEEMLKKVKGVKYIVTKGDQFLDGEHTMQ